MVTLMSDAQISRHGILLGTFLGDRHFKHEKCGVGVGLGLCSARRGALWGFFGSARLSLFFGASSSEDHLIVTDHTTVKIPDRSLALRNRISEGRKSGDSLIEK